MIILLCPKCKSEDINFLQEEVEAQPNTRTVYCGNCNWTGKGYENNLLEYEPE